MRRADPERIPEAQATDDTQYEGALAGEARSRDQSADGTWLTSFRQRSRRRSRRAGAHARRTGTQTLGAVPAEADRPARGTGTRRPPWDPDDAASIAAAGSGAADEPAPDDWVAAEVLASAGPAAETVAPPHQPSASTRRWINRLAGAVGDRIPPTLRAARWSLDGRSVVVLVVVAVLAVAVALVLFGRSPRTETVVTPTLIAPTGVPAPASTAPSGNSTATAGAPLTVHVAGLVARPGVYELPAGARVVDAIDAAGGAIDGTDLSQLNLARVLVDGEQVAVGVPAAPVPPGGAGPGAGPTPGLAPIDLNTATESDLDTLPGVGPVLAARIVAWREENGTFSSVDELLEVSGIGESTLADIAPLVRV